MTDAIVEKVAMVALIGEVEFLLERLADYEPDDFSNEAILLWQEHLDPAIERTKAALSKAKGETG